MEVSSALGTWLCRGLESGAGKEPQRNSLPQVWKDVFPRQGIRVAILLHQGTASDTGNSMGTGTEDENWGHWGLVTHSVGDQGQLGAGGGCQIRQDLLGHHVEIGLFLEAQGEDLGV